jgi:hypothetical protein
MNCTDWSEKLHDYAAGELPGTEAQRLDAHLATCPACQRELAAVRALRAATAGLDREIAPARDLFAGIAAQLGGSRGDAAGGGERLPFPRAAARPSLARVFLPLAIAASVAFLLTLANRGPVMPHGPAWNVATVAGAPRLNARTFAGTGRFHVGQWLETDHSSRAKVEVGSIGLVDVAPNSRLRLVDASATDHRLELARGELSALIWAPPRLFFVNTPSATAVDLGCAYTLIVNDEGGGELRVTSGYVALEHDGRESIIPAGQVCLTRRGASPGTPFAAQASAELRSALERFDFWPAAARLAALRDVLAHAGADDYVTLWHLLSRAQPAQRGAVFDLLAKHHPAPDGVTRAGIIAGDAAMRTAWADKLDLRSWAAQLKTAPPTVR